MKTDGIWWWWWRIWWWCWRYFLICQILSFLDWINENRLGIIKEDSDNLSWNISIGFQQWTRIAMADVTFSFRGDCYLEGDDWYILCLLSNERRTRNKEHGPHLGQGCSSHSLFSFWTPFLKEWTREEGSVLWTPLLGFLQNLVPFNKPLSLNHCQQFNIVVINISIYTVSCFLKTKLRKNQLALHHAAIICHALPHSTLQCFICIPKAPNKHAY